MFDADGLMLIFSGEKKTRKKKVGKNCTTCGGVGSCWSGG